MHSFAPDHPPFPPLFRRRKNNLIIPPSFPSAWKLDGEGGRSGESLMPRSAEAPLLPRFRIRSACLQRAPPLSMKAAAAKGWERENEMRSRKIELRLRRRRRRDISDGGRGGKGFPSNFSPLFFSSSQIQDTGDEEAAVHLVPPPSTYSCIIPKYCFLLPLLFAGLAIYILCGKVTDVRADSFFYI